MEPSDKLSIKVNIAERFYPLKVDKTDEEKIRKAAKEINDKIILYKKKYTDKDDQDFLAMVALQFATKVVEKEMSTDTSLLLGNLENLDRELGEYLEIVL
jgi:cell division protein ZapA